MKTEVGKKLQLRTCKQQFFGKLSSLVVVRSVKPRNLEKRNFLWTTKKWNKERKVSTKRKEDKIKLILFITSKNYLLYEEGLKYCD